jgi:hypothetical protein
MSAEARSSMFPDDATTAPSNLPAGSLKPLNRNEMSTQNTRPSGRRNSSRGGPPRRQRQRDDQRDDQREPREPREPRENRDAAPKAQEKKSLWQRIVGFFAPKEPTKNGAAKPAPRNGVATTTSNYPTPTQPARPARKPEAIEVTTPKVYVGNLSFDATESDLSELFNGIGGVQTAEIVTHAQTMKSKGFGFVTMQSVEEAKRAVDVLHDKEFMGRKLVVSGAKTPIDRK